MKTSDLVAGLRDLSDTLNVCGNDYSDILYTAATQLEQRLLTDAERAAFAWAASESDYWAGEGFNSRDDPRYAQIAATLRGLLERFK